VAHERDRILRLSARMLHRCGRRGASKNPPCCRSEHSADSLSKSRRLGFRSALLLLGAKVVLKFCEVRRARIQQEKHPDFFARISKLAGDFMGAYSADTLAGNEVRTVRLDGADLANVVRLLAL
jgi:hypothetical protein